jgi:Small subunit of phenylpropionate dioxygenase
MAHPSQGARQAAPMPSRSDIEDFLFREAALLDEWRLDEWLALFEEGATYEVPSTDLGDEADSHDGLFFIADDYMRLQHRITRLKKPGAHSEWPRSKTVRLVSNVRIIERGEGVLTVGSVFVTYRSKGEHTDTFFGRHRYQLRVGKGAAFSILAKRSFLDMTSLRPQGRVSIIL